MKLGKKAGAMEGVKAVDELFEFYRGKTVLITGHTGFKGTWMCAILRMAGATIIGYSNRDDYPLFQKSEELRKDVTTILGDVRNLEQLMEVFEQYQPEIVFHMAAQPLVIESYKEPVLTYETNVMGTVNLCECVRRTTSVRSFVNITTDKVYENKEWEWGYREIDRLNGYDPYSNSKSCSELVTSSYRKSFLNNNGQAVSCVRAGNVIGGGDEAENRIIPDCIRAVLQGENIVIRNPYSIRPYQHVLEPLMAYLRVAKAQWEDEKKQDCYNIGPGEDDCVTTEQLVSLFCKEWGDGLSYEVRQKQDAVHEASFLRLDCSLIRRKLGWKPVWNIETAVKKIVAFTKEQEETKQDTTKLMSRQIEEYRMENRE